MLLYLLFSSTLIGILEFTLKLALIFFVTQDVIKFSPKYNAFQNKDFFQFLHRKKEVNLRKRLNVKQVVFSCFSACEHLFLEKFCISVSLVLVP